MFQSVIIHDFGKLCELSDENEKNASHFDPHLAPFVCERPHHAVVDTGGTLAHVQRIVKEGLIFQAELL